MEMIDQDGVVDRVESRGKIKEDEDIRKASVKFLEQVFMGVQENSFRAYGCSKAKLMVMETINRFGMESLKEEPISNRGSKNVVLEGFYPRYYRDVLAMVFAIDEVNNTPELLPNITLGFRVFDSCMSESRAVEGMLALLSGTNGPVPGYRCLKHPPMAGIIGETMSSLTIPMARIMGALHYPQISHSSVISILSDKSQFPSFLRTVPGNTFQNLALARLIGHFGWTWVGMIISDDEVGLQGGQDLRRGIEENGGCVAFMERIHLRYPKEKILQIVKMIQGNSVQVIIVHSPEVHGKVLLEALFSQNVMGKVLVFSAAFAITPGLFTNDAWKILNGTLGLVPSSGSMVRFEAFLSELHPSRAAGDNFIKHFWEQIFVCRWPETNGTEPAAILEQSQTMKSCSGDETLDRRALSSFELRDLSYTYHSYLAVYAFAHALDSLISCQTGRGPFIHGACADVTDIRPWQILHYVKNLHFETGSGSRIMFDANGDTPGSYNILNVQITQDDEFQLVNVGRFDSSAPRGSDVIINASAILWRSGSSQVPPSVCSDHCHPGYRKAAIEGKPTCCYDCVLCFQGEISNGTDALECLKCTHDKWSSEKRNRCMPKRIEYLSYDEPLGLTLAASSAMLTILTASVLLIFIKFHYTPIVKANNRNLSYLLLAALMSCFLCSFIFIGQPSKITCMLRQTVFAVVFSISVSSILAKTICVVIAFTVTHPNSSAKKWLGSKTLHCFVFVCSLAQIIVCFIWLVKSPPFPEMNMTSYNDKIIIECNEGAAIFFYCMLGYMGLLATVSFIVAFLSRNLPGSFNEAKLITFSMLVFVSVWISFIPAYLSTRGKYMVAVEVFAILCSSAGLLGCIFLPKCYVILMRPEKNIKEYLVRKAHFSSIKNK
ncbi:extracellular calcium-sensing receptor-like [Ambystoma mexicanum]|uniref:extracellular calcium-sensing receptor-like n=1 Tax=Ambystoma mexicanum TaxID=8296 RepID=UPI0037E752B0